MSDNQRKELTDEDLATLQTILGSVTVTRSGMLRVMAFLVENPALAEKTEDMATSLDRIDKSTSQIANVMDELLKEFKKGH